MQRPENIPALPGVYIFKDKRGTPLYVGKASNLRSRISTYFQKPSDLDKRIATMLDRATNLEWIVLNNETEALLAEQNLIKTFKPSFNVLLKDDKSYPWIAIDMGDPWPQISIYRGRLKKKVKYFGPYAHAQKARQTLEVLQRLFPVRSCSNGKFKRYQSLKKPCLLYHIKKCSGPCVGAVGKQEYLSYIQSITNVLSGKAGFLYQHLQKKMEEAANELNYELAAKYRDQLEALNEIMQTQDVITTKSSNFDLVGFAQGIAGCAIEIFHVRGGRLIGKSAFSLDPGNYAESDVVQKIIEQVYVSEDKEISREIPDAIFCQTEPEEKMALVDALSKKRGKPVKIKVATGSKKRLLEAAIKNAEDSLEKLKTKRERDIVQRSKALNEISGYLKLKTAPFLIECYDCSHLSGHFYVGSMIVLEDGLPKRNGYRHFKLKLNTNDDYLALYELILRRFSHVGIKEDKLNYLPDLVLVDGGKGQLAVAFKALENLELADKVELASIAKQFEYIYRPNLKQEIIIPSDSAALFLLKLARDEAHRFAITYNRKLRSKAISLSSLDLIQGVGKARRTAVLKAFGSLEAIKNYSAEEIARQARIPLRVAKAIKAAI